VVLQMRAADCVIRWRRSCIAPVRRPVLVAIVGEEGASSLSCRSLISFVGLRSALR